MQTESKEAGRSNGRKDVILVFSHLSSQETRSQAEGEEEKGAIDGMKSKNINSELQV